MHERNEIERRKDTKPGAMNELAMQNVLRKRHCKDWPNVILQITKRVTAVNHTWAKVIFDILTIDGLNVRYVRAEDGGLRIVIAVVRENVDEVEEHILKLTDIQDKSDHIEVLIMDVIDHSKLIAKYRS
jgi:hypothetical protein